MSTPLRILFMGTPDFAVPALQALLQGPDQVVAVVCQPDKESGRGRKLQAPPTKITAAAAGIPVLQPKSVRSQPFLDQIAALHLDLIVVAAYGKILPGSLLKLPRLGAINIHGSLLPKYRGAAPIQWALLNGDKETGVTIMQMDEGMDTGDILLPVTIPITEEDTAGTLFARLAEVGGRTLMEAIARLKEGTLSPQKQDDRLATEAPMLTKEMGHLDWSQDARRLHCLIRGLDPWPSAYGFLGENRFRFFRPQVVADPVTGPPGTICRADRHGLLVAAGRDSLLVREIQAEGKKRMDVQSLLCGMTLPVGERFT